ncbi:MAG: lipoyl(octanoyl) transferase LipB [Bacteroidales bacterium]|nr:lipoyl(octanoyl) transferase LipB [Bacteroidales bacterium]MCF8455362.1 lipoyl(octanoyl) transferase LipB [Bacteroidales bacterium]
MNKTTHFEDLGAREYKDTWDYQEKLFKHLVDLKGTNAKLPVSEREVTPNHLLFVEHPNVYTLGKSGSEANLLINFVEMQNIEATFFKTNRGGDITYHGPGQVVGYPILDLENFDLGLKEYIHALEEVIILTLKDYGIDAGRLDGATGVWLDPDNKMKNRKICAIGVKSSRFATMHGFAFNVNTNLDFFGYINPCGFTDKSVTSLEKELGRKQDFEAIKMKVKEKFVAVFGMEFL